MGAPVLVDAERGLLGSIIWPDDDLLPTAEKAARLRRLGEPDVALLVSAALAEAGRGRWDAFPDWIFFGALRRVLHGGDTPDEAYRWARSCMSEVEARRQPKVSIGPCLVWGAPPPPRREWIPDEARLAELRRHPGRPALVHVLPARGAFKAASEVRTGKVAPWLEPGDWIPEARHIDSKRLSGLWITFDRRRAAVDVAEERRRGGANGVR